MTAAPHLPGDLVDRVRAWQHVDPDPETRAEAERLLEQADRAALEQRFGARLAFGTAGLRGPLGAGPNRMNRIVVQQTSAGLARFLLGREPHPSAVVGYDARRNSARFARDAAAVLQSAGVRVVLLPRALPTPVLAFAVRDLGVSAGVMITASHNPAPDNGYKLYLGGADGGAQLTAPVDAEVQAAIDAVVAAGAPPVADDEVPVAEESLVERYVAATARLGTRSGGVAVPWVYTPLHGVGQRTVLAVLRRAGLPAPVLVPAQAEPDPTFPTAPFPNPEEEGVLEPAFAAGDAAGATLLLANDPDADRLAVAVRRDDGWHRLTGNQVGLLLAWRAAGEAADRGASGTLATSIVSTPALARVAERFGLDSALTLTGFKWIARVPNLLLGFEEALGYLVDPAAVRDKDGVSALVAVLVAAMRLAAEGRTLDAGIARVEAAIGRFDSDQVSVRVHALDEIAATMRRLRQCPPAAIGGMAVLDAEDLAAGGDGLPPTDALRYRLVGGARVIVRPSGTEPKLKTYLDVVSEAADPATRRAETDAALSALRSGVTELLREPRPR